MDTALFKSDVEKNQHETAIEQLCEQFPERCGEIRCTYQERLEEILPQATIRSYLPIFITRKVRDSIEDKGESAPN